MRKLLAIPLGVILLTLALGESPAQPPSKTKSKSSEDKTAPAAGLVFEVYADAGGKFRYRILDGETHIGMSSKGYETKDEIKKIIDTIQKGAAKAKVVEAKASSDSKSK